MGIGYASVNSVLLDIGGTIQADLQDGVYITDVSYDSGESENASKINSVYQTLLHSNINLSDSNGESFLKYKITVYNSSSDTYYYVGNSYVEDNYIYSNQDIEISVDGIELYSSLAPGESKIFYIVFSYKDLVVAESNNLESYIIFNFKKKYTVTNLLENGSFENDVSLDYIVKSDSKYVDGNNSGKLVSNTNTFDYLGYLDFYKDHVYYFSGYIDIATLSGDNEPYVFIESYIWLDDNWGDSQWFLSKYNNYSTTNGWERWSFISVEESDGTDIPVMVGVFDNQFANLNVEAYFDSFLLIDLTETFGVGNEPELDWCDENISYFDGTVIIYK